VERAGVDDGLDAALAEDPLDERAVGDGAENLRVDAGRDVKAEDLMPVLAKPRREEAPQPSRRSGQKDAHLLPRDAIEGWHDGR
jgi:hypothetical protein